MASAREPAPDEHGASLPRMASPEALEEQLQQDAPSPEADDRPPVRILFFCFMFFFQGYGVMNGNPLFALRSKLNELTGGQIDPSEYAARSANFQWAKMSMRVVQIAFLVFLNPRGICYFAYVVMFCAVLIPPICVWWLEMTDLWVVGLTYFLGGCAVGLFEGTFLSIISPLGKNTKTFVIMGAPLGFATHNIILGTWANWGMPDVTYYIVTAICLPFGMLILHSYAPRDTSANSTGKGCAVIMNSARQANSWIFLLLPWLLAKMAGNFVLEDGFPLLGNTFTKTDKIPLIDPASVDQLIVPFALYKSLYYFPLTAAGDTISRRVPQYLSMKTWQHLAVYLVIAFSCCILGEGLYFVLVPLVTGVGAFISMFGNGFIYGLSAKFIDAYIPAEHMYASYNLWCFLGDFGGWLGQGELSVKIAESVCAGRHYTYVCHLATEAAAALGSAGPALSAAALQQ